MGPGKARWQTAANPGSGWGDTEVRGGIPVGPPLTPAEKALLAEAHEPGLGEDAALDAIYDTIYDEADDAFREGRFADIDAKLAVFDPADIGILRSLAWLSISTAARPHLPAFDGYRDRVATYVRATDPAQAEDLLRGLVPVTPPEPSAGPAADR